MKHFIIILSYNFLFLQVAFARPNIRFAQPDYANLQESIMVLNSYGVPLTKIKKNKKELTISPAYIKASSKLNDKRPGSDLATIEKTGSLDTDNSIHYEESNAKGGGFLINWFHGLGENWGYSITASHIRLSGEMAAFAEYDAAGNRSHLNFAEEEGNVSQIMAYFVYELLSKSERHGLSLFTGMGFYKSSQEANIKKIVNVLELNNVEVQYKASIDNTNYGLALGFHYNYHTKNFNFTTFLLAYIAPNALQYKVTATRTDTGVDLLGGFKEGLEEDTIFPSGGFKLSYLPWGISLSYTPNIFNLINDLIGDDGVGSGYTEEASQSIITLSKTWIF